MNRKITPFLLLLFITLLSACEYTAIVEDNSVVTEEVSFSNDIEPIFQAQSCTNCHPGMHSLDLTAGNAYASLTSGDGLVNTDTPAESKIYTKAIPDATHGANYTSAQAKLILAWIEQGAKNN